MAQVAKSRETRAGQIATERLIATVLDDADQYANGTSFIAADHPDFQAMLEHSLDDRSPIAIVYPDGREIIAKPSRSSALGVLRRLLTRIERGESGSGACEVASVSLPGDYVVELRDRAIVA